jgi:hypothetical protein
VLTGEVETDIFEALVKEGAEQVSGRWKQLLNQLYPPTFVTTDAQTEASVFVLASIFLLRHTEGLLVPAEKWKLLQEASGEGNNVDRLVVDMAVSLSEEQFRGFEMVKKVGTKQKLLAAVPLGFYKEAGGNVGVVGQDPSSRAVMWSLAVHEEANVRTLNGDWYGWSMDHSSQGYLDLEWRLNSTYFPIDKDTYEGGAMPNVLDIDDDLIVVDSAGPTIEEVFDVPLVRRSQLALPWISPSVPGELVDAFLEQSETAFRTPIVPDAEDLIAVLEELKQCSEAVRGAEEESDQAKIPVTPAVESLAVLVSATGESLSPASATPSVEHPGQAR